MQHTDKYQLNLIEASDTFSPDPLNENARRLEQAISAEAAAQDQARAADIAALDQRLQVFEAKHIAVGTYYPQTDIDVDLGFAPSCVVILALGPNNCCGILLRDRPHSSGKITSNGFHIQSGGPSSMIGYCNLSYGYIAFD